MTEVWFLMALIYSGGHSHRSEHIEFKSKEACEKTLDSLYNHPRAEWKAAKLRYFKNSFCFKGYRLKGDTK